MKKLFCLSLLTIGFVASHNTDAQGAVLAAGAHSALIPSGAAVTSADLVTQRDFAPPLPNPNSPYPPTAGSFAPPLPNPNSPYPPTTISFAPPLPNPNSPYPPTAGSFAPPLPNPNSPYPPTA